MSFTESKEPGIFHIKGIEQNLHIPHRITLVNSFEKDSLCERNIFTGELFGRWNRLPPKKPQYFVRIFG
jgi:hypothetical protein